MRTRDHNAACRLTSVFGLMMSTACLLAVGVGAAAAQTTVVINVPGSQVVDTTLRNGPYATVNQDGAVLLTRSSTVPEWERRAILSFDVRSIPDRTAITSATLTLTVKSGLGAAGTTRPVRVSRLVSAFQETQATWNVRQTGVPWPTPGGDLAETYSTKSVTKHAAQQRHRRPQQIDSDTVRLNEASTM